jgi:ABC-type transporter MlaC component
MSRTHRALVLLALCLALATATTAGAVAAQPTPPTIEDHNDRLLRHLRADQAAREQAAVQLARSMERNFVPASTADRPAAAQPDAAADTATPSRGVDMLATLLVGLVGGLVGGAAAMAAWTAATRRRLRRAASVA